MIRLSPRAWFLLGGLFCVGLILAALYFQFVGGLDPCPLCISQRVLVIAVGLIMLAAAAHNPGPVGVRAYAVLGAATALVGASISARHVWIQHLPASEVPACGPGLSYMFRYFPLTDTLRAMVTGTGDCAKVDWTLLGLSMPAWVLISFIALAALNLGQLWNVSRGSVGGPRRGELKDPGMVTGRPAAKN
ncbi:disulfide bond formation protein B [Candidatus Methylocalor cossyra]